MKAVIRKIDRSLKALYHLDLPYKAERFLIARPFVQGTSVESKDGADGILGSLFVHLVPVDGVDEIRLGIYLNADIVQSLSTLRLPASRWTYSQFRAFAVGVEEVSHFLYLLFHAQTGRQVSQLEMELQGEVDKFVLSYFAFAQEGHSPEKVFDELFDQFFVKFRWQDSLSDEQKERYQEASRLARAFLLRSRKNLLSPKEQPKAIKALRDFYRLSSTQKLSIAA